MKNTRQRLIREDREHLNRQVNALYNILTELYGADKLVLRAGKLNALKLMRSRTIEERILALQRLIFEDPTFDLVPSLQEVPQVLKQLKEEIAEMLARRSIEDELEQKINEKLQQRYEEYIREIKMQVLKENGNGENAQTLKKLALLEKLEQKKLAHSTLDILRPANLNEIVGQKQAIKSLLAKLASPFPQHILLYGPPGVGKTTAARLVLEETKKIKGSAFSNDAPFIEVNGTTLRWDPREATNPLLGSVHDPIYQGARRELAEQGIPEPKLGLVTEAHGGVLFIDEIGEMDPLLQNKLLKVLEDKRVYFESAYYDAQDTHIPQYIKKIFEEGVPANFILIGATTREPEQINPSIRSRCTEVFFDPLTPSEIQRIICQAAEKLNVSLEPQIPDLISRYTIDGRKAVGILADAYSLHYYNQEENKALQTGRMPALLRITLPVVYEIIQNSRLTPYVTRKASSKGEVGKIYGLGVMGFVGSVVEIEAVVFPARQKEKGTIRFNETAGSMAKDAVFNATSVIRKSTNEDLANYDVHINVLGGGQIDGPSAGVAIFLAILSALQERAIPQDIAVTGELSIQGQIRAVGGVVEKIYGARQAGIKRVIIPAENATDISSDLTGIHVIPVSSVEEILPYIFTQSKLLVS
ncbi:MAG TPA: ATP-dependent protease, Lon family [Desulfotomaculum sp.]|nr:ATP-dependent protease, Lon family [Desulfotomaculum sp.]